MITIEAAAIIIGAIHPILALQTKDAKMKNVKKLVRVTWLGLDNLPPTDLVGSARPTPATLHHIHYPQTDLSRMFPKTCPITERPPSGSLVGIP